MPDLDPFVFFRTMLIVALSIYCGLMGVGTLVRLRTLLAGDEPSRRLARLYLSYQLVTIRIRPLAGELVQIGIWTAVLIALWRLHEHV